MKRDLDLCREIMLTVEDNLKPDDWVQLDIADHSPEEVAYHVKLLKQAGLIEAIDLSSDSDFDWRPISLTWDGHEFLEASRDNGRWDKAKYLLRDKVGALSYEVLKETLVQIMKSQVFPSA